MDEQGQFGQNNPNSGSSNPSMPPKSSSEQKSWGPAIGLVVILLIIIAGSFYFFKGGTPRSEVTPTPGEEPSIEDIEGELMMLKEQGETDETADIEADIEATDVSGMDAELDLAEQEASQLGY